MYWSVIYDDTKDELDFVNLATHASNSVFMFIDVIIVAYPVRLLHVLQPLVFAISYGVFTIIYYFVGGTDA